MKTQVLIFKMAREKEHLKILRCAMTLRNKDVMLKPPNMVFVLETRVKH